MSIRHRSLVVASVGALLLAAGPAHAEVRTFRNPQHQGYRLDYCRSSGGACGERVATQWCRGRGYEYASDWAIDRDIGALSPTMSIDESRVCRGERCDGFTSITCGREGRTFRLPSLGSATRATVITPDRRGAAPAIAPVEVEVLVPGCYQTEPGILLCGTVHDYQHCRTLFAAAKVLGCRAGLAFDGDFAEPVAAEPGTYEVDLRSRASVTVTRGRRGEGRVRGDARFEVRFDARAYAADGERCLQRDRYLYHPNGPRGGLFEIDGTDECGEPIEGEFAPNDDDLLRAYDLCDGRRAWDDRIDGSIELLVAGLYYLAGPDAGGPSAGASRVVAPYLTIRAPLRINCRE